MVRFVTYFFSKFFLAFAWVSLPSGPGEVKKGLPGQFGHAGVRVAQQPDQSTQPAKLLSIDSNNGNPALGLLHG